MAALAAPPKTPRKKLVRRAAPDRSQALRHAVQAVFLAINVWIGVEFYLFVRYYETGGQSLSREPSAGRRRLAADRVADESEGPAADRPMPAHARRRACSC